MVISDYSFYWFQPFHFDIVLSKSVQTSKTTIWIWNLHAIPHDFSIQGLLSQSMVSQVIDARKVISAYLDYSNYPYLCLDFSTLVSLQIHHILISSCLIVSSRAHSSILVLRDI